MGAMIGEKCAQTISGIRITKACREFRTTKKKRYIPKKINH
jgi:hypothetical protein